jgi:hypothetical protein
MIFSFLRPRARRTKIIVGDRDQKPKRGGFVILDLMPPSDDKSKIITK